MVEKLVEQLGKPFMPISALLIYRQHNNQGKSNCFVEHYDIDLNGHPINAHPLTVHESSQLIKALHIADSDGKKGFLSNTIIPENLLYMDNGQQDSIIWYTRKMAIPLFFTDSLSIQSGISSVPALLWKVRGKKLSLFALSADKRPNVHSKLFKAPFFNVSDDGTVCLGTVNTGTKHTKTLEEYIACWQDFFFNSRFSHLLCSSVKGNCVQLWKSLVGTGKPFPKKVLEPTQLSLHEFINR
ncbi:PRTRC system protein B [Sphingobacterium sp. UGAL515B_05]|uniref:PRTRC system protein B n=1 Tax=Sphingobacterium sp. UGAL515B_05 TaxID=2986767 RepID=UPI0029535172|nr:PRTRC system protein B [Sphingobacterium sp. UGAL515B_05]WON93810.1 PRTRC system protein B [Sphingobacterium sp. UGAL515B_05]